LPRACSLRRSARIVSGRRYQSRFLLAIFLASLNLVEEHLHLAAEVAKLDELGPNILDDLVDLQDDGL
jgi:hypothetical protein